MERLSYGELKLMGDLAVASALAKQMAMLHCKRASSRIHKNTDLGLGKGETKSVAPRLLLCLPLRVACLPVGV